MALTGNLTRNKAFRSSQVYTQSEPLDASGEFTGAVSVSSKATVDVQFEVTGGPTGATIAIENSLDGGTTWVTVNTPTNRTANGFYKETYTGLFGQVRVKLATLAGGTTPTADNIAIGITKN